MEKRTEQQPRSFILILDIHLVHRIKRRWSPACLIFFSINGFCFTLLLHSWIILAAPRERYVILLSNLTMLQWEPIFSPSVFLMMIPPVTHRLRLHHQIARQCVYSQNARIILHHRRIRWWIRSQSVVSDFIFFLISDTTSSFLPFSTTTKFVLFIVTFIRYRFREGFLLSVFHRILILFSAFIAVVVNCPVFHPGGC